MNKSLKELINDIEDMFNSVLPDVIDAQIKTEITEPHHKVPVCQIITIQLKVPIDKSMYDMRVARVLGNDMGSALREAVNKKEKKQWQTR